MSQRLAVVWQWIPVWSVSVGHRHHEYLWRLCCRRTGRSRDVYVCLQRIGGGDWWQWRHWCGV